MCNGPGGRLNRPLILAAARSLAGDPAVVRAVLPTLYVRGFGYSARWSLSGFIRLLSERGSSRAGLTGLVLVEEGLQNSGPESLFDFEQEPYSRQIDTSLLSKAPDPEDASDVIFGIETNVGGCPGGRQEPFVLVDPERSRVSLNQACGHADHEARALRVLLEPSIGHGRLLGLDGSRPDVLAGPCKLGLASSDLDLPRLDLLCLRYSKRQDAILEGGLG